MAKARTGTIRIEGDEEDDDQGARDFAQANEDEGGDLFRITDEIRGTANVRLMIVRTYPNTPDMAGHVGDLTPGEFTIDRMRELYGPGRYRVRVVGPKGFLPGGGPVNIARMRDEPAGVAGSGSNVSDIAALLKALKGDEDTRRQQDADRRHKLLELTLPAAITSAATILGALFNRNTGPDITALITAMKPAPGPSLTDLTTSLASLKTLSGGDKTDSNVEMIFKVLELAKDTLGGDAGKGESNWVDLIRDALKMGPEIVKPILENVRAQQATPVATMGAPMQVRPIASPQVTGSPSSLESSTVSPMPAASVDSTVIEGEDMMAFAMPIIRAQLEKLLTWAIEKKRPELYAEVWLEELPAIVHQYVTPPQALEALKRPDWFAQVTTIEPRLAAHEIWLSDVRRELIDILREQLKEEPPPMDQIVDPLNGVGS